MSLVFIGKVYQNVSQNITASKAVRAQSKYLAILVKTAARLPSSSILRYLCV
jgi:hypothetical protein